MTSHGVSWRGSAAVILTLCGCSGGDLTLPDSGQGGPEQPAALLVLSGEGQQAEVGTVLDEPVTVRVVNDSAQPVSNVRVQFSFLGDLAGASLDPASVETDADGRAAASVRLGDLPGEQIVVAAVANTLLPDLRAQVSATAVLPGGGDGDGKGGKGHHGNSGD
jgi:hypothetical protein